MVPLEWQRFLPQLDLLKVATKGRMNKQNVEFAPRRREKTYQPSKDWNAGLNAHYFRIPRTQPPTAAGYYITYCINQDGYIQIFTPPISHMTTVTHSSIQGTWLKNPWGVSLHMVSCSACVLWPSREKKHRKKGFLLYIRPSLLGSKVCCK